MGMNSAPKPSPTMAMFNFRSLMACVQEFPTLILRNNRAAMRGMTPFPRPPVNGKVPGLSTGGLRQRLPVSQPRVLDEGVAEHVANPHLGVFRPAVMRRVDHDGLVGDLRQLPAFAA